MQEDFLAKAGREAHADRILRHDRAQAGPDGVKCPLNPEHGKMGVHRDGNALICCHLISKPPSNVKFCTGMVPISA